MIYLTRYVDVYTSDNFSQATVNVKTGREKDRDCVLTCEVHLPTKGQYIQALPMTGRDGTLGISRKGFPAKT